MILRTAAMAYSRVGVETGVHAASPAQLVVMLYDGALKAVADAERHMQARRTAEKGKAISMAIAIVDSGLRASLDLRSSPLAANLEQLYEYMSRRLLFASVHNDAGALQEVGRLLDELRGAWVEVAEQAKSGVPLADAAAPRLATARP